MRIGDIEPGRGQKAFGLLKAAESRGRFPVHVPLHVVAGAKDGPTLVVQAGTSGLELEGALFLPEVVRELDPAQLAGTLVVVPILNTSGFEFEQRNAVWDDKDLFTVGRGRADGTVSERLLHTYYREVIGRADALLDIHSGERWGYFNYAGVYRAGDVAGSRALAVALGLPQVLVGQPDDGSAALEAARDGKRVVSVWIGGGPGLRDFREESARRHKNAVLNALRHLGMLGGRPAGETGKVAVLEGHTVVGLPGERGFVLMDRSRRGAKVKAGDRLGVVKHPDTGDVVEEILAPRDGWVVDGGASWPMVPEGGLLALLGDLVEEVPVG